VVPLRREIAGSGLIMQPSEKGLASPKLRPYLEKYMRGRGVDAEYMARLLRMAHDLAVSSFGMRQELYEYWHGGDPNRNHINLLRSYDQRDMIERIKTLLTKPLLHQ
jgi:aromatic ring hydroxylase